MKMIMLLLGLWFVFASAARAGDIDSAAAELKEEMRTHEIGAATAELKGCAREIDSYRGALWRHSESLRTLEAEAAARDSFDYDWGMAPFESAKETLEANLAPPSGMIDAGVFERPLASWWRLWSAVNAKRALKDPAFRSQALETGRSLRAALLEVSALGKASIGVYGMLVRKGVVESGILFGEEFFLGRVEYRERDLKRMLEVVDALSHGKRARMSDPEDW